jgi:tRNA(adenine34) deaminase
MLKLALELAHAAARKGEVPVGAVVVRDGKVIGQGANQCIADHDPTAHAEIMAIRQAARALGNYRLDDCELFVTLEPCAMCAGAIMNARIKRVVFGAHDPKAGAGGSVINLFDVPAINHHTALEGGVDAEACAAVLTDFFAARRRDNEIKAKELFPLRDDALRTPEANFANLPSYPWAPNYVAHLPSLSGLRQHYLDEGPDAGGPGSAPLTFLCLHGNPSWSYVYRSMIPLFLAAGHRVVAPDLVGFGRSDKPKKDSFHTFEWHRQNLLELIAELDLKNIVLVVQDWGGLVGLTLPMASPERYKGLLVMNTTLATGEQPLSKGFLAWREMCRKSPAFDIARLFARGNPHLTEAECAAYAAPFPNEGYRAATRQFPKMVPEFSASPGAEISRAAAQFWQNDWQGQSLMAIGMQDPVLGWDVMQSLRALIRNCPPPLEIPEGGHFVQDHGLPIAEAAVQYFTP